MQVHKEPKYPSNNSWKQVLVTRHKGVSIASLGNRRTWIMDKRLTKRDGASRQDVPMLECLTRQRNHHSPDWRSLI